MAQDTTPLTFKFIGPSNPTDPINADVERTVNKIPEYPMGPGAASALTLRQMPGLVYVATIPTASSVPLLWANGSDPGTGRCFGISGTQFYELTQSGTTFLVTVRGTVLASNGTTQQTTISTNGQGGNQLFIVSGGYGYTFDLVTNAFAQITDADFPNGTALMGEYFGGYFVVVNGANSSIQLSALNDGTTWDALDVAQRQNSPDPLTACKTFHNELWLFGPLTTEVWYNSGAATFPLQPIQGGLMQVGVTYPETIQEISNTLMFCGHERTQGRDLVYQATGYAPQIISTPAVANRLNAQLPTAGNTRAWTYQEDSHSFYAVRTQASATYVYDLATQLWHERGVYNAVTEDYDPYPVISHVFFANTHLVGDASTGTIWQQSLSAYYDEIVGT